MDKPKLIIDTNVFYSLNGYNKNVKITDSIAEKITNDYELFISSVSLYEMISHVYNNEIDERLLKISIQMNYLRKHNFYVISSNLFPITAEDIDNFINMRYSLNEINSFVKKKLESEAEMGAGLLVQIVGYYLYVLSEIVYDSNKDKKQGMIHLNLTKALFNSNYDNFKNSFQDFLTTGTIKNDSDNVFNQEFQKFQKTLIDIWFIYFYSAKYIIDNNKKVEDIIKEGLPANYLDNAKSNDILWKDIESKDNLASYFRKKGNTKIFKNYLKEFEVEMGKEDYLTKETILFLKNYFKTNLEEAKKVRKNDINDIVIYSSKYNKDYQMITLDKAFIKIMKDIDIDSYNLNMKFKFI